MQTDIPRQLANCIVSSRPVWIQMAQIQVLQTKPQLNPIGTVLAERIASGERFSGSDSSLIPDFSFRHFERQIKIVNKTRNTLPTPVRKEAIVVLNNTVADLFDLFARIKQAHWNVRGTTFIGLHKLLDEFAGRTLKHVAEAGERVRQGIKKLTDAEDFGTPDLLTDILRTLDLQLWLLEAHITRQQT